MTVDIWQLLEQTSDTTVPQDSTKPKTDEEIKKSKKKVRHFLLFADIVSLFFWTYLFVQLFLFNVDGWIATNAPLWLATLFTYKFLLFFIVCIAIGAFLWRWLVLVLFLYVVTFPLLAIIWRIPRWLYKAHGWLGVMGFVNAIGISVKNFRYNLITKSLAIISGVIILFIDDVPIITALAAFVVFVLLIIGSVRTLRLTLRVNWFLDIHERIINKFVNSQFLNGLISINPDIKDGKVASLDSNQANNLTNSIQFSLMASKGLYFWAYQLQQYREKYINVLFSVMSFMWLLLGGVLSFWLINVAIYEIDPNQYIVEGQMSNMAMLVYSLSGLFFSDGAGISAADTFSYLSRILAGCFGTVFFLTIIMNVVMILRQSKEDEILNETVKHLKTRANSLEEKFEGEYHVTPDEAIQKMTQMKKGMYSFISLMASTIPKDFLTVNPKNDK